MRLAIVVSLLCAPICNAADRDAPELPLGLQHEAAYLPVDNPQTTAKVALGKQLFFDPRLSRDQSLSCASCHDPEFAFTDGKPVSHGIYGRAGRRSAPTLVNQLFSKEQFWDGRAADLEAQSKMPITNPDEMGSAEDDVVERIRRSEGYRRQFRDVFGGEEISIDQIANAIAAFERTLLSGDAAFDRFAAGDSTAISVAAMRGEKLFKGRARHLSRVLCLRASRSGVSSASEFDHSQQRRPVPQYPRLRGSGFHVQRLSTILHQEMARPPCGTRANRRHPVRRAPLDDGVPLPREDPYFAITGADGSFEITDVPPGEHLLRQWHETLGRSERKVIITEGAEVVVMFGVGEGKSE